MPGWCNKILQMETINITSNDLMSINEACKYLNTNRVQLWRWEKSGRIRTIKLANHKFIPVSEIERIKDGEK